MPPPVSEELSAVEEDLPWPLAKAAPATSSLLLHFSLLYLIILILNQFFEMVVDLSC